MTTLLRALRLYPLALWVGGEIFFIIVAGIAFGALPDAHSAGLIVRGSLLALHRIGLGAGIVYLLASVALFAYQRSRHLCRPRVRLTEITVVVLMLVLTAYSQWSVIPRMEQDRLSLGGDVAQTPVEAPAHVEFDRLHKLSVNLEGAVLLGGFVLIALAALEERPA